MPRRPHKPTDKIRAVVRALAGYGVPSEHIAANPEVRVARSTLWKYYADELAEGNAAALGKLGEALFQRALNGSDSILIFLGKTRLGLKEVSRQEQTGADGGPIKTVNERSDAEIMEDVQRLQAIIEAGKPCDKLLN